MSFISKKPSAVPRVLCADLCPPCNILHDIDDYASFYDPCYHPHLHPSVFATRESTCAWLLSGLQSHSLTCERHSQTLSHVLVTTNDTSASPIPFFHFFIDGVHLCVPFADIESSSFSFCRLQRLHDLLLSKVEQFPSRVNVWSTPRLNAVIEVPTWLHQTSDHYFNSLSSLSLPQLTSATTFLQRVIFHPKSMVIRTILDDFFEQRSGLWRIVRQSSSPCAPSLSRYFLNRYQDTVFHALCDLRTPNHFHTADSRLDLIPSAHSSSSEMWLYQTLDEMDSRLRRAPRDEILSCLHSIPSHLRPQYSTRSVRACRTPLLLHIWSRIWYLRSLSDHSFFQVLFSIFPFHNNTSLSRDALTEVFTLPHVIRAESERSPRTVRAVRGLS